MRPNPSLGYHLTGKAIFKERDGVLICIDGQQRSTTVSLMVAALRDAALELVRQGNTWMATFVAELDALLFRDPRQVYAWADGQVQGRRKEEINDGSAQAFGVPILMPSFEDRIPFFRAITEGILRHAYLKAGKAPESDKSDLRGSVQSRAKGVFDKQLYGALSLQKGATARREFLAGLVRTALDVMAITFCEILNDIDFPQVFLWFQEKSLFSMGALLHNPAPGVAFRAADLLRNLMLAPSMRLSLQEQEILYRQRWLEPFERANGGSSRLDPILEAFIEEKMDPRRLNRHVSDLEKFAESFLNSTAGSMVAQKSDVSGVITYARLLSFAEAYQLKAEGRQLPAGESSVALSQETCDQLITMLVDFANCDGKKLACCL